MRSWNRVLIEKLTVTKWVITVFARGNVEIHPGWERHQPIKKRILKQVVNVMSYIQDSHLNKRVIYFPHTCYKSGHPLASLFYNLNSVQDWSQWPCGLRWGSEAARLLGLCVRIPPEAWMSFCCECCVCCQVEVSATSWSLVQRSYTDCDASLSVI